MIFINLAFQQAKNLLLKKFRGELLLSTESKQNDLKQYTYCPECGKLMKIEESDDNKKIKLCVRCIRKYRPKF